MSSIIVGIYTFLTISILTWFVIYFGGNFGLTIAPIVAIALAAAIISGQIASLKKSLLSSNEDSKEKAEETDNQE